MRRFFWLLPALLMLLAFAPARAELSLSVEVGWDGHYRIGRWTPLFLTVSDSTSRAVIVEIRAPHSRGFGMDTRLGLSVSPTPATYPVYIPLSYSLDDLVVVVRDARTERRLAQWRELDQRGSIMMSSGLIDVLIGTSGRGPTMRAVAGHSGSGNTQTVFIPQLRLPANPAGYDSLNLLVLNQPDLNQLHPEQHQAIADWVRGGGKLVMWPGVDPIPPASPLVAALPCEIGENINHPIDTANLDTFGLSRRFANMPGRVLLPKPGAQRIGLFGDGGPDAWQWNYGFGQVLMLPVDPTFFVFRDEQAAREFWHPLLGGMLALQRPGQNQSARYYYWNDPALQRRSSAFNRAADLLGDVPGVGQFGFSYVVIILLGLMFVVGPVDWFVLKYLGRQPWTWATTSGWIALVTVGALFVGTLLKSGDLHFRTLRVIDQIDAQTLAVTDLVCIYAPRTRFYEIQVPRESWWQPAGDVRFGQGGARTMDIPFLQDTLSNRPGPMLINVWNLRFLVGETMLSAPPIVEASLALHPGGEAGPRLVGTITNRSPHVLRNVKIRSGRAPGSEESEEPLVWRYAGGRKLERVEPGGTVRIELNLQPATPSSGDDGADLWTYAGDLDADRAAAVDRLLAEHHDIVCIYAEVEAQPSELSIRSDEAIERHWQVLRALVRVSTGERP